jgi:rhomboid protease GluP
MPACPRCGAEMPANAAADEVCTTCGAQETAELREALIYRPKIHLTNALILANVLMFLVVLVLGTIFLPRASGRWLLPQFTQPQLIFWGANWGPLTLTIQPWRLLTANYLHGGILHIATNMFCLWGLGRMAESFYSKPDFLLAYTFTGIAGALASVLVTPIGAPSVGASGAVFGIAGLMLATMRWGHIPLPGDVRTAVYKDVLRFSFLNLAIGFVVPHIDNMGHVGGLLSGVLAGVVLGRRLDRSPESIAFRWKAWAVLVALLALAIYGTMRFHYRLTHEALRYLTGS